MADVYKVGAVAMDNISGRVFKTMVRVVAGVAAGTGYVFKRGGVNYAVTAGKTFYPTGMLVSSNAASNIYLCYADNTALTTNRVSLDLSVPIVEAASHAPFWFETFGASIPAGKYFGIWTISGTDSVGLSVIGYEA